MQEKTLLKLCLAFSLIGIFSLLFISEKFVLPISEIDSINKSMLDREVKIRGAITGIGETPGLLILTVKDSTGRITVIAFKQEEIELEKDLLVEIQGTVMEYKNKIEINAKSIKLF